MMGVIVSFFALNVGNFGKSMRSFSRTSRLSWCHMHELSHVPQGPDVYLKFVLFCWSLSNRPSHPDRFLLVCIGLCWLHGHSEAALQAANCHQCRVDPNSSTQSIMKAPCFMQTLQSSCPCVMCTCVYSANLTAKFVLPTSWEVARVHVYVLEQ